MPGAFGRRTAAAAAVFLVLGLSGAQSAPLAVFTVTNTNDSGAGSLRQAIFDANDISGPDTITIDISPAPTGVVTITPVTPLPIINEAVDISAAPSSLDPAGLPYVRVDGSTFSGASPVYGLEFDIPSASTSSLSGLAFTRWLTGNTSAIRITGTGLVTVTGTLVGTDQTGMDGLGNYDGIEVWNGSTIGGTAAADRNIIVGSTFQGVWVIGSDAVVQGNWIGLSPDGATLNGNGRGVQVLGSNVTVGGTTEAAGNRIVGNSLVGVQVAGGTGNTIRHNSIDSSGGLGIDLGFPTTGVTPNDPDDADTGPNDLQNFPVLNPDLTTATAVVGDLNSVADATFDVDVYSSPSCDPSDHGEGATHIASFQVTTNGSGDASFNEPLSPAASGFITATATDASGNTSEFSACHAVSGGGGTQPGPTFTVNSNSDLAPTDVGCTTSECTLREAIDAGNAAGGLNTIVFDLLPATRQIALTSGLPPIDDPVMIDGAIGELTVELNGDGAGTADGLVLATGSDGSTIENLEIRDFSSGNAAAVRISSASNTVRHNSIWAVDSGVVLSGEGSSDNVIGGSHDAGDGNRIWAFVDAGVDLATAGGSNRISGNTIGLDESDAPSAGDVGIAVRETPSTVIGANAGPGDLFVLDYDLGNVIVAAFGEGGEGILLSGITSSSAVVAANFVGTDRTASATDLGNTGDGIRISEGLNNQIGPGNTIAHNGRDGVDISNGASGNRVVANVIRDNEGLGIDLVNANNDLSQPVLDSATLSGSTTTINGSLSGVPGRTYFVEWFKNTSCDGSGFGEGDSFISFTEITLTDDTVDFDASFLGSLELGEIATATLTDSTTGDTSEFSNCVTVEAGGGGGAADPPVLFAAVPNVNGATLGVAGLLDTGVALAGTQFAVSFFSVPACDPAAPKTPLGTRSNLVTNATGVGAFAIDGLTNVSVGTLVTATASLGGDPSSISNCVVADLNNTSWPTALALAPTDSQTGHLRAEGEARWFKVPIVPHSRLEVSLSGLPADYDLVVLGDVQAAYDRLNGGADYDPVAGPNLALDDLAKQGAETPTDVFNTSQYNPASWDPTNWDPTLNANVFSPQFSPTQWSPTQWSATQWSPTQWSPTQWSPTQWSPTQWSPTQWSPTQWSPTQWSPTQWSTSNPADPRTFSAAQTASVLAASADTGTGNESVSVNTWNNTGFFYVRVQGKNGSFAPDQPFTLDVSRLGNVCQGVADQPSEPTAPAGNWNTVILVDSSRMTIGATLSSKLNTFAARPEVRGVVVDVNGHSTVAALNAQADGKKGCPFAKNLVASAITRIVDAYRASNPIKYVVVIGDDAVIPFYRYPDPALLGNETLYVPPVKDDSASQASLRLGHVLNQDGYGSSESVSLHGNQFPIPDLAVGRLVETPLEIEGLLDAYLATTAGVVPTPTSSLVTGYDFLQDTADAVAQHLSAGIGGTSNHTLITDRGVSPGTVTVGTTPDRNHSWTGADLRRSLLNSGRHDLVFLAGHFSANDALGADYRTNVLSTELPASGTSFVNSIVFSAGCHAGYNIVNGDATTVTEPLDWAQAFARKGATLIAGTGYQYGDTDFLAHSERIYVEFARQLRITSAGGPPAPVAVGTALLRAKRIFLETTPGLTSLDEKALLQTTLFGLPMLSVNLSQGRIVETPDGTVVSSISPVGPGPGAQLGLGFADLDLTSPLDPNSLQLTAGPLATYLSGPDGVAVRPTQPIIPLDSLNVTSPNPGLLLRGVAFRGGAYTDTNGVTPLTAAPATELRGVHAPFFTDVFFPTQPWTANFFDAFGGGSGATRLHVTPVQHRSNVGGDLTTSTRRQFSNVSVRLFYSGNVSSYCPGTSPLALAPCPGGVAVAPALSAPPTITGVETSFDQDTTQLTFEARILGEMVAGIQAVWVTWTIPPAAGQTGSWQSLDLALDPDDPTLWTGTLNLPSGTNPGLVSFVVQAVNGVGRVTIDDNVGAFYRPGSIPGPPEPGAPPPASTTMTFTTPPPASVAFGESFPVTVELTAGGSPLSGKTVHVGIGSSGIPAVTNGSGRATVTLRAALTPAVYQVTGSFAGDATHAASDASTNVTVVAQPTSLTLAGTGTRTIGSSTPLTATLKDTDTPPAPLHQRTVFVIFTGTSGVATGVKEVFTGKTDPLGRVEVPQAVLGTLPAGSYDVDAFFNGVNVPGVLVLAADNVDYGHSEAHATMTLVPRVLFASSRTGNGDIYAIDPAGGTPIRLTDSAAIDAEPEWSPSGLQIVFSSTRAGNVELFVMDYDGTDVRPLATHSAIDTSPTWSPDGEKIAFASNRAGNWDIWVLNVDGSGSPSRLTTDSRSDLLPSWSRNGSQLAFMSMRTGGGDIYTMNADGSLQTRRTTSPAIDTEPAWFGSTIAFSTNRHGSSNFELYTMTSTGGSQTRRTTQAGHDLSPAWSPDGTKLVFASNRSPGGGANFDVYTMSSNGTNPQPLVVHPAADGFPDW